MENRGKYDAVAVRELSRFGRSLKKVLEDVEKLNQDDVEFISLKEDFNTNSAMGKAMMQMIGVFNEFWANLARERAVEMHERKKAKGEPVGRPEKLSPQQVRKLIKMREDKDMSWSSLGKFFEVHRTTAKRYYQRHTGGDST